jgi:hypothetical protein
MPVPGTTREVTGVDAGPWPGPLGSGANRRGSPVPLSGKGNERWRVDLPTHHVIGVSVGANGLCFVTSERGILALDGPSVRWAVETVARWGCVLLADGLLVTAEETGLVVREQLTGSVVSVIAATPLAFPWPMAPGCLTFLASAPGGRVLRSTMLTGEVLWEHPVHAVLYPPLVRPDLVAVAEETVVRAVGRTGRPLWSASRREFATGVVAEPRDPGSVDGQLVGLPNGNVLVPIRATDVLGYLVVDPRHGSVRAVPADLRPGPLAVPLQDLLVLRGWPDTGANGDPLPTVTVVDLATGAVVGRHRVPAEAQSMAAGANGLVAVAGGPSWHGPREECYVVFLDEDGVRAEWTAGEPLTGPIAVGADGDVLVPVPGQLVSVE